MDFEYDLKKSKTNGDKHGVDFEKAKTLWDGLNVILEARSHVEARKMIIGSIDNRIFTCVFTLRKQAVRIISCRRSRKREENWYHDYIQKKMGYR